jgi:hypothetical protein
MLEGYTLLGPLATQTRTMKLGTLVTGVTYRNPALVAKIVRRSGGSFGAWLRSLTRTLYLAADHLPRAHVAEKPGLGA